MDANLFNISPNVYVYAIGWRYFGEPREMRDAEAERENDRLAKMMLKARWQAFDEFMREQGQFAEQVILVEV